MEAQRKAIVIQDRAKNKGLQDMRKGMDEYNKLKAEEMKKKAFNAYNHTQTYKNEWLKTYYITLSSINKRPWVHSLEFLLALLNFILIELEDFGENSKSHDSCILGPYNNFD